MQTPNDSANENSERIALFRYGIIGDLVHLPPGSPGIYERLREKAELDYNIPGSTRVRVAPETIRDWLKKYRKSGFDGLKPKPRSDLGNSRLPRELADLMLTIKDEHPDYSVQLIVREALASGKVPEGLVLAPSTVHRLLSRAGLMAKKSGTPTSKDHRRFEFEKAGDLWMSDVMHGPAVFAGGRKRRAYLISLLDDATRVIPYAAFALSENTAAFLPVFKEAILRRGLPRRLFVDNGSAYRSHHLAVVCAKLGVTLIHARAHHPQAKGKKERFYLRVRTQLMPTIRTEDLASVDALNRRLWAWVEGEYHCTPHRGLGGETPLGKWAHVANEVRYLDDDIDELFLHEAKRRVAKDRTVSLNGLAYEVEAALVGETVTLRFDPSRPGRPIQVWFKGAKVQHASTVDVRANCFVKRNNPLASEKTAETSALKLSEFASNKE